MGLIQRHEVVQNYNFMGCFQHFWLILPHPGQRVSTVRGRERKHKVKRGNRHRKAVKDHCEASRWPLSGEHFCLLSQTRIIICYCQRGVSANGPEIPKQGFWSLVGALSILKLAPGSDAFFTGRRV